jgi:hypothetical protein
VLGSFVLASRTKATATGSQVHFNSFDGVHE